MDNDIKQQLWRKYGWLLWTLLFSFICFISLGFYLQRDVNWNSTIVRGVLSKYSVIAVIVWLVVAAIASMSLSSMTLGSEFWRLVRQRFTGVRPQTPLERLQEEFEALHPDRAKKEEPPVPIVPPQNDDNPYSYR